MNLAGLKSLAGGDKSVIVMSEDNLVVERRTFSLVRILFIVENPRSHSADVLGKVSMRRKRLRTSLDHIVCSVAPSRIAF